MPPSGPYKSRLRLPCPDNPEAAGGGRRCVPTPAAPLTQPDQQIHIRPFNRNRAGTRPLNRVGRVAHPAVAAATGGPFLFVPSIAASTTVGGTTRGRSAMGLRKLGRSSPTTTFSNLSSGNVDVQILCSRPDGGHRALQLRRYQGKAFSRVAQGSKKPVVVFRPALIVVKSGSHVRCL
jgi:hypothetical protein